MSSFRKFATKNGLDREIYGPIQKKKSNFDLERLLDLAREAGGQQNLFDDSDTAVAEALADYFYDKAPEVSIGDLPPVILGRLIQTFIDENPGPSDDQIYNRPGMEGGIPY